MNKMKLLMMLLIGIITTQALKAQEWNQGRSRGGVYTIGVGGTQQIRLGTPSGLTSLGLAMNVQGEYGIGKFMGLGWQTGVNLYFPRRVTVIEIPIGLKVNVHILDAANANVRGLDVFAGINVGGGPGIYSDGSGVVGLLYVGPQVGLRYWFNPNVAIFTEFGWGATFANLGFTF